MGSHSVTCHSTQVSMPRLNSSHAGRYSIYLPRRDGRLSWPCYLVTQPPGFELATSRSRPESNALTTEPPSNMIMRGQIQNKFATNSFSNAAQLSLSMWRSTKLRFLTSIKSGRLNARQTRQTHANSHLPQLYLSDFDACLSLMLCIYVYFMQQKIYLVIYLLTNLVISRIERQHTAVEWGIATILRQGSESN